MRQYTYLHRVSYGETDTMGVLYYGEYFHIFERARSEFIRSLGMSYAAIEQQGIYLPVRGADCRYKKPAHYDELLEVKIGISACKRASILFAYEISFLQNILATGSTEHAFTNQLGKPCAIPHWFMALLEGWL